MSRRLVEILEYGWDLDVQCIACGRVERRSKAHFLGAWRKYLNAEIEEMARRMICPGCGAKAARISERGAQYAYFGLASEVAEGRAILIRKTLSESGLDPAAYGYPPFDTPPRVTHQPR